MLTVHEDLRACRSATSARLPSHRVLIYHEGSRQLQVRYDSPRLADHLKAHVTLTEANRALIEQVACFFLATPIREPSAPTGAGLPGFVRIGGPCESPLRAREIFSNGARYIHRLVLQQHSGHAAPPSYTPPEPE